MNSSRESQAAAGVPSENTYALPPDIYAGLLAVGSVCNALVGPPAAVAGGAEPVAVPDAAAGRDWPMLLFRWAVVGLPLGWGVAQTAPARRESPDSAVRRPDGTRPA